MVFRAQSHGIMIIGNLQTEVNPPSVDMLSFQGSYLGLAIKTGFVTGILSLTEGIAVGRTFAAMRNYHIVGNKEMVAIGLMDMAGSCTSCFVTSGSFSRSAINHNAGCAYNNAFSYYATAVHLWKVDKLDFFACLCGFFGVLFISVQVGLAIAVGVSFFKNLVNVTWPNITIMGNVPGTQSYRNLGHYKDALIIPSFIVLGIESPIYFVNSMYLQERVMRWIREEEERATKMNGSNIKCIVLEISAVMDVDSSGIDALLEIKMALERRSLQLVLANPLETVALKLNLSEAWEKFGSDCVYNYTCMLVKQLQQFLLKTRRANHDK